MCLASSPPCTCSTLGTQLGCLSPYRNHPLNPSGISPKLPPPQSGLFGCYRVCQLCLSWWFSCKELFPHTSQFWLACKFHILEYSTGHRPPTFPFLGYSAMFATKLRAHKVGWVIEEVSKGCALISFASLYHRVYKYFAHVLYFTARYGIHW